MQRNYAVLDKYYNVISGSPEFFSFFGSTNFLPLLKMVHEDEVKNIEYIVTNLSYKEERVVCRIKNTDNKYVWFFLKIKKLDEETMGFEFLDIDSICSDVKRVSAKNSLLSNMLNLLDMTEFEYNPVNNILKVFRIDANREYCIYNGDINDVFKCMMADNIVADEHIDVVESLKEDIKQCKSSFNYNIRTSAFSRGDELKAVGIKGGCVYFEDGSCLVSGVIIDDSQSNIRTYKNDPMTGVLDKVSIISYAKNALCDENNKNVILSIIDMDDFKSINDNLGHAYGDNVIIQFSNILTSFVGSKGAVGRFGGDEFMVVFDDLEGIDEIRSYFRAIRSTVEMKFKNLPENLRMTCSIGICSSLESVRDYDKMFEFADACLYLAKDQGKNRYVNYEDRVRAKLRDRDELPKRVSDRATLKSEFVIAATEDLFNLGEDAFDDVIKRIGRHFGLYKIKFFEGDGLKLSHFWNEQGEEAMEVEKDADWLFKDDYLGLFSENSSLILERVVTLGVRAPSAYNAFDKADIGSVFQFLIKNDDKIVGLVSFEKKKLSSKWADSHISNFMIISQLVSQILKRKYAEKA